MILPNMILSGHDSVFLHLVAAWPRCAYRVSAVKHGLREYAQAAMILSDSGTFTRNGKPRIFVHPRVTLPPLPCRILQMMLV
jgi:hypothetical protein